MSAVLGKNMALRETESIVAIAHKRVALTDRGTILRNTAHPLILFPPMHSANLKTWSYRLYHRSCLMALSSIQIAPVSNSVRPPPADHP